MIEAAATINTAGKATSSVFEGSVRLPDCSRLAVMVEALATINSAPQLATTRKVQQSPFEVAFACRVVLGANFVCFSSWSRRWPQPIRPRPSRPHPTRSFV